MDLFDFTATSEAKEVLSHVKSQSEVEALTFADGVDELERVKQMLSSAFVLQQDYAMERLPLIVAQFGPSCVSDLIDRSRSLFPRLDIEGKILLATSVKELATKGLVPAATAEGLLLPLVLGVLRAPEDDIHEIVDAYGSALEALGSILGKSVVRDKIVPVSISMSKVENTPIEREISCMIAATALPSLTRAEVQQFFYGRILEMCQDPERAVRAQSCRCLGRMKELGREVLEGRVLKEVFELMDDEDNVVREAALDTLLQLLDFLSDDVKTDKVVPFVRRAFNRLAMDPLDPLAVAFSKSLGPLLAKVGPMMQEEDREALAKSFKMMATFPYKEDLRQNCAFNFLAVLTCIGGAGYAAGLHDTLTALVNDQDRGVRQRIAAQFHEILGLLGKDRSIQFARTLYEQLARDAVAAVREEALARLKEALTVFSSPTEAARAPVFASIIKTLQEADRVAGPSWRTRHLILLALPVAVRWFQAEQIAEVLMPLALKALSPGAPAVLRPAAADALVALLRAPRLRAAQRTEVFCRVVREFARSRSCLARLSFVELAGAFLRRFSSKFFRENVFDFTAELLNDSIANVRIQAVKLLPQIKQTIRLPVDVEYLDRLTQALRNLISDVDRDVAAGARDVQEQFKAVPIRMARGVERDADDPSGYGFKDRHKEEEEAQLQFTKDELEKLRVLLIDAKVNPNNMLLGKKSSNLDLLGNGRGGAAANRGRNPVYRMNDDTAGVGLPFASPGLDLGVGPPGAGGRTPRISNQAPGPSLTRPRVQGSTGFSTADLKSPTAPSPSGRLAGVLASPGGSSTPTGIGGGASRGPANAPGALKVPAPRSGSSISGGRPEAGATASSRTNGIAASASPTPRPGMSPAPIGKRPLIEVKTPIENKSRSASESARSISEAGGVKFPPLHANGPGLTAASLAAAQLARSKQQASGATGLAAAGGRVSRTSGGALAAAAPSPIVSRRNYGASVRLRAPLQRNQRTIRVVAAANSTSDALKGDLATDIMRALPLWAGGMGFVAVLANRAISGIAPVVDASSSQSRSDVLAIVLSAILLLTGFSWLSLKPRQAEAVALQGVDVDFVEGSLPLAAANELKWAWQSLSSCTSGRALVAFYRGRCIAHFGKGPGAAGFNPSATKYGPICERVAQTGEGNYLANLLPYPGRFEFYPYLPDNTQAVLLTPLGTEGVLVVAADAQRGFAPLDQAWISAIADKIDSTMDEAGFYPSSSGFSKKK